MFYEESLSVLSKIIHRIKQKAFAYTYHEKQHQ